MTGSPYSASVAPRRPANAYQTDELFRRAELRPSQPSTACRILTVTSSMALVGVVSYALASGVNGDNYDQVATYRPDLRNGLIGAAGVLGGALLPPLAAWGRRVVRALCERDVEVAAAPHPLMRMQGVQVDPTPDANEEILRWELHGLAGASTAAPASRQSSELPISADDFSRISPPPARLERSQRGLGEI